MECSLATILYTKGVMFMFNTSSLWQAVTMETFVLRLREVLWQPLSRVITLTNVYR